jgi:hypothetical protein
MSLSKNWQKLTSLIRNKIHGKEALFSSPARQATLAGIRFERTYSALYDGYGHKLRFPAKEKNSFCGR